MQRSKHRNASPKKRKCYDRKKRLTSYRLTALVFFVLFEKAVSFFTDALFFKGTLFISKKKASSADSELFSLNEWPTKGVYPYFLPGPIVRDPLCCKYPTRCKQDLNQWSSGLVEWICAVVINTTPQCHYYNHYTTALYVEGLRYEFATMFVSFVCISLFCFANLR